MKTVRKTSRGTAVCVLITAMLCLTWVVPAFAQPGPPPGPPGMGGHMRPPPPGPELLVGIGVLLLGIAAVVLALVAWQALKLARERWAPLAAPVAAPAPLPPAAPPPAAQ